jgi:hypothetical protein
MPHWVRAGGLALAALLIVSACKRAETPAPAPTPAPSPPVSAPTPTAAPLAVEDISLGKSVGADKSIAELATEFAPTDTFYVSVKTTGAAPSAKLTALWTYEDGQSVAESSEAIAPTGPATTEFHVSKPDGWPPGGYRVQVFLDGKAVGTKEFAVK